MSLLFVYKHSVNPKLKHIYLSFDDTGTLVVKSPKICPTKIEKLLIKKSAWIKRSREKLLKKKGKPLNFTTQNELYFLGEAYLVECILSEEKQPKLLFDGHTFKLYYSHYDRAVFEKLIDYFYQQESQRYLPAILDNWAQHMNLTYHEAKYKKTKRQWGSCSAKNTINLNTSLMKLPPKVIEYVIIHELAHIKHKHHKKTFWEFVGTYMPTYQTQRDTLKNFIP